MISFASSAATTSFLGPKLRIATASKPSAQRRPMSVSASFASSTVERPRGSRIKSDSLYEVLGIRMEATCQEIKSAYRRLARVVHPDVAVKGRGSSAADEFMKIHEAYSTLSDPEKRADYDRLLLGRQWIDTTMRSGDSYANAMSSYGSAFYGGGYARSSGRTWETDQCW